jgi:two-component system, NarL family, invasion response regulator UvrY
VAVDDQLPFLALLRDVVRAADWLTVVGEATSGEDAIDVAARLRPDMIVMDVRMPGVGGIAAARHIKHEQPSTVIVLVSATHPDDLRAQIAPEVVDAIIWKSELGPTHLNEAWRQHHRRG